MSMAVDFKKRIERLRARIRRHDYLYYVLAKQQVGEQQRKQLFLRCIEQETSIASRFGTSNCLLGERVNDAH